MIPAPELLRIHGLRIARRLAGEGPALVVLHHAGGSSRRWSRVLSGLGAAFRVHLLDLPGHGASEPPAGSAWEAWRATLPGYLEHEALDSPAVLAHSLSGLAVVQNLLCDGLQINRAVLVAPPASHDLPAPIRISRAGAAERAVTWKSFQQAVRRRLAADPSRVAEEDWAKVHEDFAAPKVQKSLRTLLADYPDLDELPAPASPLPPLHFLWGDRDAMVPGEVPERWVRALPAAEHHQLPGLGHLPMLEDPKGFLETALRLLEAGS